MERGGGAAAALIGTFRFFPI
jgi:hypothetical protein